MQSAALLAAAAASSTAAAAAASQAAQSGFLWRLVCCAGGSSLRVQPGCSWQPQQPQLQQQHVARLHTSVATCSGSGNDHAAGADSSSSSGSERARRAHRQRLHSYRARLPRAEKYGQTLAASDPASFEAMRQVVGYYDLPQNRGKARPPPPGHATINLLQTLKHTADADPYYKLALLSYRSKLANNELLLAGGTLARGAALASRLAGPPDWVPAHLQELVDAAAAAASASSPSSASSSPAESQQAAQEGGDQQAPAKDS